MENIKDRNEPYDDTADLEKLDTIPTRLRYFAEKHPERELFVFCTRSSRDAYTASRLLDLAGKFAGHLVEQGFQRGDFLANSIPNSPERLITDLGAMMAGCATFNIPVLYNDGADLYHMARRARCKGVIVLPTETSPAWQLLKSSITDHSGMCSPVACDQLPYLITAVLVRSRYSDRPFIDALEESTVMAPDLELRSEDVAAIFHTSGSTGLPKLVHKTHHDLLGRCAKLVPIGDNFSSNRGIVYFNDRILGWMAGYPLTTYAFGDTRVMPNLLTLDARLDSGQLYEVFVREKCNGSIMLPASIHDVSQHIADNGLESRVFQTLIISGYPIRQSQVEEATQLAAIVVSSYGLTEVGFITRFDFNKVEEFSDCNCGKPQDYYNDEFRVEDDDGAECDPGVVGHILQRGTEMFAGYLNLEESPDPDTVKTIRPDGWIDIGDYGFISEDGNLFVMGRGKDCINIHGMMFYPSRLEAKLLTYPGILDAVAVPVSDVEKSQVICACLKAEDERDFDTDDLSEFCKTLYQRGSSLMVLPIPKFFLILKDNEFPKTLTGKPDRTSLRIMAEKLYGKN